MELNIPNPNDYINKRKENTQKAAQSIIDKVLSKFDVSLGTYVYLEEKDLEQPYSEDFIGSVLMKMNQKGWFVRKTGKKTYKISTKPL